MFSLPCKQRDLSKYSACLVNSAICPNRGITPKTAHFPTGFPHGPDPNLPGGNKALSEMVPELEVVAGELDAEPLAKRPLRCQEH